MPGTYRMIELVGTSFVSFAEAVKVAISEASNSVQHMDWFEVVSQSGRIADGKLLEFQVTLKIGSKM
jgi:flavin-binding protein dodecin